MFVCVCVCVCVYERERESEIECVCSVSYTHFVCVCVAHVPGHPSVTSDPFGSRSGPGGSGPCTTGQNRLLAESKSNGKH